MQETNTLPALPETFKPEVFKSLIDQAPAVYINSQSRVNAALKVGQKIVDDANVEKSAKGKISPEMDARLNKYMVNIRTMVKEINEARTPITQMFNQVVKLYTGLENEVDPKNSAAPAYIIQKLRDEYATILAQEEKKRLEEAARKMAKDKEAVDLKIECERQLLNHYNKYLQEFQQGLTEFFEDTTLESYEHTVYTLKGCLTSYPFSEFAQVKPILSSLYHMPEEKAAIIEQSKSGKHPQFDADFREQITALRDSLLDKLPSKKVELQEKAEAERQKLEAEKKAKEAAEAAARASAEQKAELDRLAAEAKAKSDAAAAEQKRLQDEELARKKEEADKLAADNKVKFEAEAAKLETDRAAGHANTLFNSGPMGLDIDAKRPQVREGYEITVSHPLGYQVIAAFYFEKEGKNEPIDKLETKTLGSMRKFCESYAQKNGERIDSPYLKYTEVYKSVNKK